MIKKINNMGQSIWVDHITRPYLVTGEFESHLQSGVTGITSNPSILLKSISETSDYDDIISKFSSQGKDSIDLYEEIICKDISVAAKLLYSKYISTNKIDGYISIEVDPAFAHRVDATICQGSHLYNMIGCPNVMIKVPSTDAGIESFRELIFEGVNVNMTLLFSVDQYEKVARAYVLALQDRYKHGRSLDIASVASFFVSRIDSYVDRNLIEGNNLEGKAAIWNARLAYAKYYEIFHSSEFVNLRKQGAQPQRLLWASTSNKNPKYAFFKYVLNLIAKDTINTLPLKTLNDLISCQESWHDDLLGSFPHLSTFMAEEYFDSLSQYVDFNEITFALLSDGIDSFASSFDELMSYLYFRLLKENPYARRNLKP